MTKRRKLLELISSAEVGRRLKVLRKQQMPKRAKRKTHDSSNVEGAVRQAATHTELTANKSRL